LEKEKKLIGEIFNKDELNLDEFSRITVELLNFPKMFNKVLFDKITIKQKISQVEFLE
jgi:hypothetical protein